MKRYYNCPLAGVKYDETVESIITTRMQVKGSVGEFDQMYGLIHQSFGTTDQWIGPRALGPVPLDFALDVMSTWYPSSDELA